jgi:hypothetical protein
VRRLVTLRRLLRVATAAAADSTWTTWATLCVATASCTPFTNDAAGDAGLPPSSHPMQSTADDATADGGLPCDPTKPFGPPTFVAGLTTVTGATVASLRLTPDYDTAYFAANYQPNSGGSSAIYTATRAMPGLPFQNILPVAGTSLAQSDYVIDPTLSRDGLTLLFAWGARGTALQIESASRATTSRPFSYVGTVPHVNDFDAGEDGPFLREDGAVLYFASDRVDGDDIFRARWNASTSAFDAPAPLSEINTVYLDGSPVVTPDDRTLFFASNRPDVAAQGDFDIWMATRESSSAPFSSPTIVPELSTPYADRPTFVTRDACTLYFSVAAVDPDGEHSELVAQRPAP